MQAGATQHDKLLHSARVWVAQTFYGQMLKQMRESPFHSNLFDGGRGGQMFANQLDQKLAERMASSRSGGKLAQSIVKHIERNQGLHHGAPTTNLRA